MFYRKVFELRFESLSIGTGSHKPHHNRGVVLQPCISHHHILLIVERIEYLHGIEPPYGLDPHKRNRSILRNDAPIAGSMSHDSTEVEFSVNEFDARLNIIPGIDAQHQSRLIETGFVITRHFHFRFELPAVGRITERSVVNRETVM